MISELLRQTPHSLSEGILMAATTPILVAVIGRDQPGIVACVSSVMTHLQCNIIRMTQAALNHQFAGIYIVTRPEGMTNGKLTAALEDAAAAKKLALSFITRDADTDAASSVETEPFVISVYGPDRNDIVGTFAHIFGEQGINIEALQAFPLDEATSMQVFEVSIPKELDTRTLHKVLIERAKAMGLSLTMQHRAIFEAVHRVEVI